MEINGKTALVTGAAGCLGRALTSALETEGAQVIAIDRDDQGLEQLRAEHPRVRPVTCDLTDAHAVESMISGLYEEGHAGDILVNNAGSIRSCPLVNLLQKEHRAHPVDLWQEVLGLNLDTVFFATRAVADGMLRRRRKGVIVNISSVAAGGNAGQSAYAAAKAGVNALTAVWGRELGPLGIRCVAVAPGFMDTASTRSALSDEAIDALSGEIPLRRLGRAEDVANAVLHAIQNDYINGKTLPVDGGMVI